MAPKRGHEGRPVTIADLVGSDDEADEDFVPDEEEAPVPKRAKEAKPEPAKKEVREEPKEDIDALWSSFNAPTKPEAGPSKPKEEKVVREYQFAGKTVKCALPRRPEASSFDQARGREEKRARGHGGGPVQAQEAHDARKEQARLERVRRLASFQTRLTMAGMWPTRTWGPSSRGSARTATSKRKTFSTGLEPMRVGGRGAPPERRLVSQSRLGHALGRRRPDGRVDALRVDAEPFVVVLGPVGRLLGRDAGRVVKSDFLGDLGLRLDVGLGLGELFKDGSVKLGERDGVRRGERRPPARVDGGSVGNEREGEDGREEDRQGL